MSVQNLPLEDKRRNKKEKINKCEFDDTAKEKLPFYVNHMFEKDVWDNKKYLLSIFKILIKLEIQIGERKSMWSRESVEWIDIELTSFCNIDCAGCFRQVKQSKGENILNKDVLTLKQLKKWITRKNFPNCKLINFVKLLMNQHYILNC